MSDLYQCVSSRRVLSEPNCLTSKLSFPNVRSSLPTVASRNLMRVDVSDMGFISLTDFGSGNFGTFKTYANSHDWAPGQTGSNNALID